MRLQRQCLQRQVMGHHVRGEHRAKEHWGTAHRGWGCSGAGIHRGPEGNMAAGAAGQEQTEEERMAAGWDTSDRPLCFGGSSARSLAKVSSQ